MCLAPFELGDDPLDDGLHEQPHLGRVRVRVGVRVEVANQRRVRVEVRVRVRVS